MGVEAKSGGEARDREVEISGVLSYDIPHEREISETDEIDFEFECEAGKDGKCTVFVLGSTTVKGLVVLVEEHRDVHLPQEELASARASIFDTVPPFDSAAHAASTSISTAQVA